MHPAQSTLRPALTLAVITPFLTELLSGNQSVIHFFFPPIFLFLLVVYGLPILLIRDYWIQSGASLSTLLFLGFAYGIYNEGIVAKTLLRSEHVPLGVFNGYTVAGINWAWAALIVPWHALQAVIAPIILMSWWDPTASSRLWLPRRLYAAGVVLSVLVGFGCFFVVIKPAASPIYLFTFFALIAGLGILVRFVPGRLVFLNHVGPPGWRELAMGLGFYPTFVVSLCFMAATHSPTYLIIAVSTLWLVLLLWLLGRRGLTLNKMVVFCLSDCLSAAIITGLIMAGHGNLPGALADSILAILFVFGLRRVWKFAANPPTTVATKT